MDGLPQLLQGGPFGLIEIRQVDREDVMATPISMCGYGRRCKSGGRLQFSSVFQGRAGDAGLLAEVVDWEVDLPLVAGFPHATLRPALDRLAVSRDLADEALVEAGAVGAVPILAGGPPDLPGRAFEGHHEQPFDPSRVEVVHRLRLAVGRAADDRDTVGHLRGLAH